jgi:hypothetical protein
MSVPQTPKRAHLLRSLIDNQRVRADGPLDIGTMSHELAEADGDLDLANRIAQGTSGAELPVLYLSRRDDGTLALSDQALTKLALDLCGVAHVVVEPSRGFSFDLREQSGGRNVYGGTLGLSLPGRGFVRRLYLGPALPDEAALSEMARRTAVDLRTAMPTALGWDWHDLQDEILREQRARDRKRLSEARKRLCGKLKSRRWRRRTGSFRPRSMPCAPSRGIRRRTSPPRCPIWTLPKPTPASFATGCVRRPGWFRRSARIAGGTREASLSSRFLRTGLRLRG